MRTWAVLVALTTLGWTSAALEADDSPASKAPASKPQMVLEVPNFVGMMQHAAQEQLRASNLQAKVVTVAEGVVGSVLAQRPAAGTHVPPHSTVTLEVGVASEASTVMPRLVGRFLNVVRPRYEPIYLIEVAYVGAQEGQPGEIVGQLPEPRATHPFRGRIRLRVVPQEQTVPVVLGQTELVARARLQADGYIVTVQHRVTSSAPGVVIEQDPVGGAAADRGSPVRLTVSTLAPGAGVHHPMAPADTLCPELTGLTVYEAYDWIRSLGLTPRAHVVRVDEGRTLRVLKQDPVAGVALTPGTVVSLTIGRRVGAPQTIPIPLLLGLAEFDGTHALQGLGFRVRIARRASGLPVGTILEQLPPAGTLAAQRSDLVLFVAARPKSGWKPPAPVVPEVQGLPWFQALARIYATGLNVRVVSRPNPMANAGLVADQLPPAGGRLLAGSAVTLILPTRAFIPDLRGASVDDAVARLQRAGLEVAYGGSVPYPTESVVDTQVPGRGFVARGSTVTLHLRAQDTVVLPSVLGQTVRSARTQLAVLRLTIAVPEGTNEDAVVTSQDPVPGTRVRYASTVALRVGP